MLGAHEMHQKGLALEKQHKLLIALAVVLGILLAGIITAAGYMLNDALKENASLEKRLATCEQEKANLAAELKYCRGINTPRGDAALDADGQPEKWEMRDGN